jgi:hypothetical protein
MAFPRSHVTRGMNNSLAGGRSSEMEVSPHRHDQRTISNSVFYTYKFRMIVTVNSDYFLKQRLPVDLCNGEVRCSL